MNKLMRYTLAAGGLAAGLALSTHDAAATMANLSNPNFDANVALLSPNSDDYITQTNGTGAIPGWTIVSTPRPLRARSRPYYSTGVYFNSSLNRRFPRSARSAAPRSEAPSALQASCRTPSSTWNGTSGTVTVTLSAR